MYMEAIDDELEKEIDETKRINGKLMFKDAEKVYAYGNIDLNNRQDLRLIKKYPIINEDIFGACNMYTNIDFNTGLVRSDDRGIFLCSDTWNKIKWLKYNLLLLGNPNKVIIYSVKQRPRFL